jgi:hypothetical protein
VQDKNALSSSLGRRQPGSNATFRTVVQFPKSNTEIAWIDAGMQIAQGDEHISTASTPITETREPGSTAKPVRRKQWLKKQSEMS